MAAELTPGGNARVFWDPNPANTNIAYYEIHTRSEAVAFTEDTTATFNGNTADVSGLDLHKSYELAVVAVNTSEERSEPLLARVPYAPRRTPMSLLWDDITYSPATSFDDLNQPLSSSSSKEIPYDSEAHRVKVGDSGNLVVNTTGTHEPIRFTGVNLAWSAAFPEKTDAPKIAARMAQFGINLVRFHNQDRYEENNHDLKPERTGWFESDFETLDEDELDKLDFFIAELAKQGIYTNINLLVGREFPDETNPTGGVSSYKRFKGLDQMDPDIIQAQQDLAYELLNRQNQYRNNTAYKDDPAIAIIEINNETSLIDSWGKGRFDPGGVSELTGVYDDELSERWSDWLRNKYGSLNNGQLAAEWAAESHAYTQAGQELLSDPNFTGFDEEDPPAGTPWKLQVSPSYSALAEGEVDTDSVGGTTKAVLKVTVTADDLTAPSTAVKVLYTYIPGSAYDHQIPHKLRFHARVGAEEENRVIHVGYRQTNNPWTQFHFVAVTLTKEWQQFDVLLPDELSGQTNVDITFANLAEQEGEVWLSGVSLKEGSPFVSAEYAYAEHTTVISSDNHVPDEFPTSGTVDEWHDAANGHTSAEKWDFIEQVAQNEPTATFTANGYLSVHRNSPSEAYISNIIVRRSGLNLVPGRAYELTFEARFTALNGSSLTKRRITLNAGLEDAPFTLYQAGFADVHEDVWTECSLKFVAAAGADESRIQIQMGTLRGTLEFRDFELCETTVTAALAGDTLEGTGGTVAWPRKHELRGRTRKFQRDWMNFLWDTETAYFKDMHDYLKDTLEVEQLVIGSQGEFSPNYLQAQDMDIIDGHGYSNHPYPKDNQEYIANIPMAGRANGGALAPRQAKRILGMPFLCTEYNHPSPNTYGSEGFPLLAAFAGFHQWDGVVVFHYEDVAEYFDREYESSSYAAGRSTGKMIQFPFLARALRDGLFEPAASTAVLVVDKATVIDVLLKEMVGGIKVDDFTDGDFRLSEVRSLEVGLVTTMEDPANPGDNIAYAIQPSTPAALLNDEVAYFDNENVEQSWDSASGEETVMIMAPKAKALIGRLDSTHNYALGDNVKIKPNETMQTNGASSGHYWAGYALILKEGTRFGSAGSRWLVTTMGYTDNLFRKWEPGHGPYNTDNKIAQGGGGEWPNFVERICGTLEFLVTGDNMLMAWDLDENGNRLAPLKVTYVGSGGSRIAKVNLPASPVSPWYEFSVEMPGSGFTMSVLEGDGYEEAETALGVKDGALEANTTEDSLAPNRNVAWESTTTASGVDPMDILRVISNANGYDSGYAFGLYDNGTGRGAKIDLRGQNIPLHEVWSFSVALRLESGSQNNEDAIHLLIGQDRDAAVVEVRLKRDGTTSKYKVGINTKDGWEDAPDLIDDGDYVVVEVSVDPAQTTENNHTGDGTLTLEVNGQPRLTTTTLEPPSTFHLPDELHIFTGDGTTGVARVDAISVTIP